MLGLRVSPEERAEIEDAAAEMGLSIASYIRDCVLTSPQTKKTRKPSIERAKLAQMLGQLGKVKASLDQIARRTMKIRALAWRGLVKHWMMLLK